MREIRFSILIQNENRKHKIEYHTRKWVPRVPSTRYFQRYEGVWLTAAGAREEKNQREWLRKSGVRRGSPRIDVVKAPDRCLGSTVFGMSVHWQILLGYTRCPIPRAPTTRRARLQFQPRRLWLISRRIWSRSPLSGNFARVKCSSMFQNKTLQNTSKSN